MHAFTPVARKSLATLVFEQVRDQIISGAISPGEALPSERVLAEMLQVNRGAIREGLKRLEHSGLVTIHQGGATRALDFRSTAGLELLQPMIKYDDRLVVTVATGVLEMRAFILPAMARASAERGGQDAARELAGVLHQMQSQENESTKLTTLSLDYWQAVVAGAENMAFQFTFNRLRPCIQILMDELFGAFEEELTSFEEYADLTGAIGRGSGSAAAKIAKTLLKKGTIRGDRALAALDEFATEEFGDPF